MTEIEIKVPRRQAPPSPKNICAFGKLNPIKIKTIKHRQNKTYAN